MLCSYEAKIARSANQLLVCTDIRDLKQARLEHWNLEGLIRSPRRPRKLRKLSEATKRKNYREISPLKAS